ncbi:MAG: hypothetical protein P4L75_07400 [Clostridia bacterium]|nr:hypothetical protein [Clostridia bacterium]MDR3645434.1 hypothetical protein [Clostridia bacterium]
MAAKENLAYDLSLFEPREQRPSHRKTLRVLPAPKARHLEAALVLRCVAVSIFILLAAVAVMMSHVQLTELGTQISSAQTRLTTAKSEQVRLDMLVESRMSLQNVEDYAVNRLGMQKIQSYQIQYININNADQVVVSKAGNTPSAVLDRIIAGIESYFK